MKGDGIISSLKKNEILDIALTEFAQYGYERANTNKISKAADVSKGLIFHYFGSKQQLYMNVVEKCIDDILAFIKFLSVEEEDFTLAMLGYYRHRIKFFREHPMHYKMLMQAINSTPKEIRPEVDKRLNEINSLTEGILLKHFEKLPLKQGVKRETALSLIIMVFSIIESRHVPMLYDCSGFSQEQYNVVENECGELIKLVLYGIAYESTAE